jgi:hypothetical protein
MNEKVFLKIIAALVLFGGIVCFVLPPLMSSKSDLGVLSGLVVMLGMLTALAIFINRMILSIGKKEEPKK